MLSLALFRQATVALPRGLPSWLRTKPRMTTWAEMMKTGKKNRPTNAVERRSTVCSGRIVGYFRFCFVDLPLPQNGLYHRCKVKKILPLPQNSMQTYECPPLRHILAIAMRHVATNAARTIWDIAARALPVCPQGEARAGESSRCEDPAPTVGICRDIPAIQIHPYPPSMEPTGLYNDAPRWLRRALARRASNSLRSASPLPRAH